MRNDLRHTATPDEPDEPVPADLVERLRVARHVTPGFQQRVMDAVYREAAESSSWFQGSRRRPAGSGGPSGPSWWRRPLSVTPLAALAAAALLVVGSVFASRHWHDRSTPPATAVASAPRTGGADTVYVFRFMYVGSAHDMAAQQVSLVGDFNGWSKGTTRLSPTGVPGVWTASVTLPRGRHEYAFVVKTPNGERWYADPSATPVRDEFGTETSVVIVGRGSAPYHS